MFFHQKTVVFCCYQILLASESNIPQQLLCKCFLPVELFYFLLFVGSSRSKSNCSKTAFSVWTIFSTFFVRVNWITKYNWATIVPQYVYTKCTFPDGPEAIMSFLVFTLSFVFVSLSLRKVFFLVFVKNSQLYSKAIFFNGQTGISLPFKMK